MKKVIIRENYSDTVYLDGLDSYTPIFAKKEGKLVGMVVLEYHTNTQEKTGWILKIGGGFGLNGYRDTLEECIKKGIDAGYEFFVEE